MRYFYFACALIFVGGASAQSPSSPAEPPPRTEITLTLGDAIKKTLDFSPSLTAAQFDIAEATAKQAQAYAAGIVPELSLTIAGGPVPDVPDGSGPENGFPEVSAGFGSIGPFIRARVEALQPIYTFGKISNLKKAAEHGVTAKTFGKSTTRNNLIFQVKRAYFSLAFLYSLREFIDELEDRSKKARDKIEERLKSGSGEATDIDLMRLEVFLGQTEKRRYELVHGIEFAKQTLAILTGLSPKTVDIVDKGISVTKIDLKALDHYIARMKVARPELVQLEEAVKASESYMKTVRAGFYPSFFIAGFYNYAKAPERQSINNPFLVNDFNFSGGGAFLGMQQNLSFHMTHAKHREAAAQYHKISSQRDLAVQGLQIELRKSYNDFAAKQNSYEPSERSFKAGRSWVLATTLNFGAGLVPIKDLLEAFVAYSSVKASYIELMYDFNVTLSELSRVVGEELTDVKY